MSTAEVDKKLLSPAQLKRAERAKDPLCTLAAPTVQDCKHLIQANLLENCPVTKQDIKLATRVFGPQMAILKGEMTRRSPTPFRENFTPIPKKLFELHNSAHVFVDVMFINKKVTFLTTISKGIVF